VAGVVLVPALPMAAPQLGQNLLLAATTLLQTPHRGTVFSSVA
jgi:hypothetical protein